jgi:hypothetical protein
LGKAIRQVAAGNTVLTWAITAVGYFVITAGQEANSLPVLHDTLKAAIGFVSLLQAVLIVCYWKRYLAYLELLRAALHPFRPQVSGLLSSPKPFACCLLECLLHLFIFLPAANYSFAFSLFGISTSLTLDEVCYISILLRNYHSLRLLYWLSDFCTLRMSLFAEVANVRSVNLFVLRCYLTRFGLPLILGVYAVMVVVPGATEYILEHEAKGKEMDVVGNGMWLVFNTQTTIGYGESSPITFLGQLAILVSALFGYFTLGLLTSISGNKTALSLHECTYYSETRYKQVKLKHKLVATLLMQRWWRLMAMRMRKELKVGVILGYFTQLQVYKHTLVACQRVKDTRFERQIAAFARTFALQSRNLQEYLSPAGHNRALIIDVFRSSHSIKSQCQELRRLTRRLISPHSASALSAPESESEDRTPRSSQRSKKRIARASSGQGRAKAQIAAFQNVRSRLVKQ